MYTYKHAGAYPHAHEHAQTPVSKDTNTEILQNTHEEQTGREGRKGGWDAGNRQTKTSTQTDIAEQTERQRLVLHIDRQS